MSDPTPFVAALREELLAAARRQAAARRPARTPRRLVLAVAVVVSVGAALVAVLAPRPERAAADVVVRIEGDEVEVLLVDLEQSPRRIEAAARAAGLDVSVRAVPVGPSNVGRFVGQESSGPLPGELRPIDASGATFRGFALPRGWPGTLRLLVGSRARRGEPYAVFSDALAHGEALACRPLLGLPAATVAASLARERLLVTFVAAGGGQVVPLTAEQAAAEPWARWVVVGADGTDHRTVVVRLGPTLDAAAGAGAGCSP